MKICSRCKVNQPVTEFYANKRAPDGLKPNCKRCHNEYSSDWNARNAATFGVWRKQWRAGRRSDTAAYMRQWRIDNAGRYLAAKARRRVAEHRIPKWANEFFIEEAYALAAMRTRMLGVAWEVDHIVPLLHPLVCGLHVHDNLRVITASENRSKSNRHWPGMP